jgi:hypothetical protein
VRASKSLTHWGIPESSLSSSRNEPNAAALTVNPLWPDNRRHLRSGVTPVLWTPKSGERDGQAVGRRSANASVQAETPSLLEGGGEMFAGRPGERS